MRSAPRTPLCCVWSARRPGRITAVGIALGIALGWLGTQALLSLMGGPAWQIDWLATAGVAGVFAATIALGAFGPAWRAVRLEPSTVLHHRLTTAPEEPRRDAVSNLDGPPADRAVHPAGSLRPRTAPLGMPHFMVLLAGILLVLPSSG